MPKARYISGHRVDSTICDREPNHASGLIQPHAATIVIKEPELTMLQVSANTGSHFGFAPEELLNQPLALLLGETEVERMRDQFLSNNLEATPHYLPAARVGKDGKVFELLLHRNQGLLILECERSPDDAITQLKLYPVVNSAIAQMQRAGSVREFCQTAADEMRRLTGFDRVMVYKFNEDDSGDVVAESLGPDREPYLGLRSPASDIPRQARALDLKNRLCVEVDLYEAPVPMVPPVNPGAGAPLDLSYAVTRSLPPAHIKRLSHLGATASMSISITKNDRLWGMIACRHYTGPKYTPHNARMACEYLAHFLSLQMALKENAENHEYIARINEGHHRLAERMTSAGDWREGLLKNEKTLRAWIEAGGVALCSGGQVRLLGQGPSEDRTLRLAEWLRQNVDEDVFATNHLAARYPEAAEFQDVAGGLLAARLSRRRPEYALWFRPAIQQVINWQVINWQKEGERATRRKSSSLGALWRETVEGRAAPWKECEVEAARMLRRSILEIIARKAEEIAGLNAELERSNIELDSFAYIASHDLKEPLRGIHQYSNFLMEDYADKLDEEGLGRLQTMVRLTRQMETLVDSLLYYSRVGRAHLAIREVDLDEVVNKTLEMIAPRLQESGVEIRRPRRLPAVRADHARVGEIFHNLIVNAIKYNDKPSKWVEIGWEEGRGDGATGRRGNEATEELGNVGTEGQEDREKFAPSPRRPVAPSPRPLVPPPPVFYVRDNGIGIPERHYETIFGIFKRLHKRDEFGGGVGAGLTIVKKIVERHNGRIWIESRVGEGTTIYFTLS